jgi:hypothetical protein
MGSRRASAAAAGFLPAAVRLALDDEIVGVAGEAIDRTLGADGVGEGGEPFVWPAIRGRDDRADPVALGQETAFLRSKLGDTPAVANENARPVTPPRAGGKHAVPIIGDLGHRRVTRRRGEL